MKTGKNSKGSEEQKNEGLDFDVDEMISPIPSKIQMEEKVVEQKIAYKESVKKEDLINCLRNERVVVKLLPKSNGRITNPKHILFGGMAESAQKTFVVPMLSSGLYVNVLTDSEKKYLEHVMGLEYNALSIYKRENNFWDDSNTEGINKVTLYKQDNIFDLSVPEDYIRYKILLANKNAIAPSLQAVQDHPKATYQFVIVSEDDVDKQATDKLNVTMRCFKEYGKIEDNVDIMKFIVEILDGRPVSEHTKKEWLQNKIYDLIQANAKMFLKVVTDPTLPTKVLIRKAISAGIISKRGDYLYLRSDGSPLCEDNEEPTLNIAATYLNNPKHQEIKFSIEAKLKE